MHCDATCYRFRFEVAKHRCCTTHCGVYSGNTYGLGSMRSSFSEQSRTFSELDLPRVSPAPRLTV